MHEYEPRDPVPPERLGRYLGRVVAGEGGCWIWTGYVNGGGYAEVCVVYRKRLLHRLVYDALVRPLDASEELHHLCAFKRCVNPGHVQPHTKARHAAIHSDRLAAFNEERRAATACSRGHAFDQDNTGPARVRDPVVWTNDDRTLLVRRWASGDVEVASRESAGHTWGPPTLLSEER